VNTIKTKMREHLPHENDRWSAIQNQAKNLLLKSPVNYFALRPTAIPEGGGIYLITLKEGKKKEYSLFLSPSSSLRHEIVNKRTAFFVSKKGGETVQINKWGKPSILLEEDFLPYIQKNCFIRILAEENAQDRLALTIAVSLLVKPVYINN